MGDNEYGQRQKYAAERAWSGFMRQNGPYKNIGEEDAGPAEPVGEPAGAEYAGAAHIGGTGCAGTVRRTAGNTAAEYTETARDGGGRTESCVKKTARKTQTRAAAASPGGSDATGINRGDFTGRKVLLAAV